MRSIGFTHGCRCWRWNILAKKTVQIITHGKITIIACSSHTWKACREMFIMFDSRSESERIKLQVSRSDSTKKQTSMEFPFLDESHLLVISQAMEKRSNLVHHVLKAIIGDSRWPQSSGLQRLIAQSCTKHSIYPGDPGVNIQKDVENPLWRKGSINAGFFTSNCKRLLGGRSGTKKRSNHPTHAVHRQGVLRIWPVQCHDVNRTIRLRTVGNLRHGGAGVELFSCGRPNDVKLPWRTTSERRQNCMRADLGFWRQQYARSMLRKNSDVRFHGTCFSFFFLVISSKLKLSHCSYSGIKHPVCPWHHLRTSLVHYLHGPCPKSPGRGRTF